MATISKQSAYLANYSSAKVRYFPEGTSQTFVVGSFVKFSPATGLIACTTGSGFIGTCGIALQAASRTATTAIMVYLAEPGVRFGANVTNGGSAQVTANSQIGKKYGLYLDTATGNWYVDIGNTSNLAVVISDLSNKDNVGDTYGRVEFEILSNLCQLSSTTS